MGQSRLIISCNFIFKWHLEIISTNIIGKYKKIELLNSTLTVAQTLEILKLDVTPIARVQPYTDLKQGFPLPHKNDPVHHTKIV